MDKNYMKNKLTAPLMLLLALAVYFFTGSVPETGEMQPELPPAGNDAFILGAMNSFRDYSRTEVTDPDKFGMNLWHRYSGSQYDQAADKYYPKGWSDNDLLLAGIGDYYDDVTEILDSNEHAVMKTLLQRPKIEWLCYGQRSDYQCEEEQNVNSNYWFYTFQRHKTGHDWRDNSAYGENQWVRYCRTANSTNQGNWTDQPDTVAARLIANNEQSDGWTTENYNTKSDTRMDWLIKPSIRIDSSFANNPANFNTPVCRIEVYNVYGYDPNNPSLNRIKSVDLRCRHFLVDTLETYNGRYIEEYTYLAGDSNLTIHGAWSYTPLKVPRGRVMPDDADTNLCKSDIRVYWYGNVDMWIDYVRVDNDIADGLLGPRNMQYGVYDQWIKEAAESAHMSLMLIKPEVFQFNNLPCIKYVEQKMKEYSHGNFALICEY